MHRVIRIVFVVILALVSTDARAAGQQASASPAKPTPAPTPIPLAKVPLEVQSTLTTLQEIDANVSEDQTSAGAIGRKLFDQASRHGLPAQAYLAKFSPSFIGVGSRVDTARYKFGRATRASGSVEQDLAGNAAIGKRAGNAPVSLAAGAECSRLR